MARSAFLPLFAIAVLGAAGCTNLGAVRDFAATSAEMTDYKATTERYVTSAERQLAEAPPSKRFDANRRQLGTLQAVTSQDRQSLLKLHAVTTGYMAALAGLAEKNAYSLSPEIDQVSGAIAASERLNIDEDHVGAYADIAKRVVSWMTAAKQARDVRRMVQTYGPAMDKLLEAMQVATAAYGVVLQQEAETAEIFADYRDFQWANKLAGEENITADRREVIATLLRRSTLAEQAAQADALKRQRAAAEGLAKVRDAHAALLKNVHRLKAKDVQAMLKQATADLKAVRKNLAQL